MIALAAKLIRGLVNIILVDQSSLIMARFGQAATLGYLSILTWLRADATTNVTKRRNGPDIDTTRATLSSSI